MALSLLHQRRHPALSLSHSDTFASRMRSPCLGRPHAMLTIAWTETPASHCTAKPTASPHRALAEDLRLEQVRLHDAGTGLSPRAPSDYSTSSFVFLSRTPALEHCQSSTHGVHEMRFFCVSNIQTCFFLTFEWRKWHRNAT